MPELPEIEAFRRQVEGQVKGRIVAGVKANRPEPLNLPLKEWQRRVSGAKILGVERKGKALLFHLDRGQFVFVHLRMGGRIRWQPPAVDDEEGVSVALEMKGGGALVCDLLQLGQVHLHSEDESLALPFLRDMGLDPLSPGFSEQVLAQILAGKRKKIKALLCDQTALAGIGNEYSAEILWQARIHPNAAAEELTRAERHRLYQAIRNVLDEAVNAVVRGGAYDFQVVQREGEKCPRCSAKIEKMKFGGRGTYLCPKCQKRR